MNVILLPVGRSCSVKSNTYPTWRAFFKKQNTTLQLGKKVNISESFQRSAKYYQHHKIQINRMFLLINYLTLLQYFFLSFQLHTFW